MNDPQQPDPQQPDPQQPEPQTEQQTEQQQQPQGVSPQRRLQELRAIPERDRTDAQWDELNEIEIALASANRAGGPPAHLGQHKPQGGGQNQQRHGGPRPQQQGKGGGGGGGRNQGHRHRPPNRGRPQR